MKISSLFAMFLIGSILMPVPFVSTLVLHAEDATDSVVTSPNIAADTATSQEVPGMTISGINTSSETNTGTIIKQIETSPVRLEVKQEEANAIGPAIIVGGGGGGLSPSNISPIPIPQNFGFMVFPGSGSTSEDGNTFVFTITTKSMPTAPVTITLSSTDISEGTVSSQTITFYNNNSQTVVVTGVDDPILDGDIAYSIISSPAISADPNYNGLKMPDILMTNIDNETAPPSGGGSTSGGSGSSGSSGGGGSSGGQRIIPSGGEGLGEVLGATTENPSCNVINSSLRRGRKNDIGEVMKLQNFLRSQGFTNLKVTGVFDNATFDMVSAFQERYNGEILSPWGINNSTGYVYILTKKKINEIACGREFPISSVEQREISDSFLLFKKRASILPPRQSTMSLNKSTVLSVSTR